jgi:hypothetical protein
VYDKLAAIEPQTIEGQRTNPRATLFREVKDLLLESRRYVDFLAGAGEPETYYQNRLEFFRMAYGARHEDDPQLLEYGRQVHLKEAGELHEALLGARRDEAAARIQQHILEFDDTRKTCQALAQRARRAGRPEIAETLEKAAAEKKDG